MLIKDNDGIKREVLILIEEIIKAQNGDVDALYNVAFHNNGLLVKIASQYLYLNYELEDLYMIGFEALCSAIKKYDINKGYKFPTYAGACIGRRIKNYIKEDMKKNPFVVKEPIWFVIVSNNKNVGTKSSIEDYLEKKELYNEVSNIISNLPLESQKLIKQRYFNNISVDNLAEIYKLSRTTIYNRLYKIANTIKLKLYENKIINKEEYLGIKKVLK